MGNEKSKLPTFKRTKFKNIFSLNIILIGICMTDRSIKFPASFSFSGLAKTFHRISQQQIKAKSDLNALLLTFSFSRYKKLIKLPL